MRTYLIGLAMVAVAVIMMFLPVSHVFSTEGGAIYYISDVVLGAAGVFVAAAGWGKMASKC